MELKSTTSQQSYRGIKRKIFLIAASCGELNQYLLVRCSEREGGLKSWYQGNKKLFSANTKHPLFSAIHNLMLKQIGFDKIIDTIIEKLGDVKSVFVVGDFANGIDTNIIDLLFIGKKIDQKYLAELVLKAEKLIERRIRYLIYSVEDFENYKKEYKGVDPLLLWKE